MTHIIREQYLHVEVNGTESDGLALQHSLPGLCQHWLIPAIERALERCAPPDGHLYIERLELDAGNLTLERLEHDLPEVVAQALEKSLRGHIPPGESSPSISSGNIQHKTAQRAIQDVFIYFLRTGRLPWSFPLSEGSTLEQVILASWQEAAKSGHNLLAGNDAVLRVLAAASVRKRLIRQFSPVFLETLLTRLSPEGKKVVDGIFVALQSTITLPVDKKSFERQLWETGFARVATASSAAQGQDKSMMEVSGSWQIEHPEAREGIYIDNAGLVLLHPFLPRFFTALGIAAEDELLQPERALCLLHFLSTGQHVAPEYELFLPKILCNVPLETPVESDVALTTNEKKEAIGLLEAAIRHWDALRNTSPDGLRGTFLMRPGKVSLRDDGEWLLQVESKTCDILLDQLPWGVGMIKLPWMERMLWVEWR